MHVLCMRVLCMRVLCMLVRVYICVFVYVCVCVRVHVSECVLCVGVYLCLLPRGYLHNNQSNKFYCSSVSCMYQLLSIIAMGATP